MKCPSCTTELKIADRSGVEIDYCPSCRGVWLDRGELDKILERSSAPRQRGGDYDDDDDDHRRPPPTPGGYGQYGGHGHHSPYKKKKSWLGEMFDFD